MSNPDQLLSHLDSYHNSLLRHITQVQEATQELEKQWLAFRHVYEGEAAEKFQISWSRTMKWRQEHLTQLQSLALILQARINALAEMIQPGGD